MKTQKHMEQRKTTSTPDQLISQRRVCTEQQQPSGAAASKIKTWSEGRFFRPELCNASLKRPENQFFNLDPQNLTFSKFRTRVCGRQLITDIQVILSHNKVQYKFDQGTYMKLLTATRMIFKNDSQSREWQLQRFGSKSNIGPEQIQLPVALPKIRKFDNST